MTKGYLGDPQRSPKDGTISNRVGHLFIFLAWLYLLPSEPFMVYSTEWNACWDIHHSPLQRSSNLSSSADVISLVGTVLGGWSPESLYPLDRFPSGIACGRFYLCNELLSPAGVMDDLSPAEILLFLGFLLPSSHWILSVESGFLSWDVVPDVCVLISLKLFVLEMSVCQHSSYINHACVHIIFKHSDIHIAFFAIYLCLWFSTSW
jgi:hypothetical protein